MSQLGISFPSVPWRPGCGTRRCVGPTRARAGSNAHSHGIAAQGRETAIAVRRSCIILDVVAYRSSLCIELEWRHGDCHLRPRDQHSVCGLQNLLQPYSDSPEQSNPGRRDACLPLGRRVCAPDSWLMGLRFRVTDKRKDPTSSLRHSGTRTGGNGWLMTLCWNSGCSLSAPLALRRNSTHGALSHPAKCSTSGFVPARYPVV